MPIKPKPMKKPSKPVRTVVSGKMPKKKKHDASYYGGKSGGSMKKSY